MKTLIAASVAIVTLAAALPVDARTGNSSLKDFNKMRAEMPVGGYPTPFSALIEAFTSDKDRQGVADKYREQGGTQSSKGARGYTGN
ncbi:MAG: hypothetical protein AAF844_06555 [Pseudomonadota bacterium]